MCVLHVLTTMSVVGLRGKFPDVLWGPPFRDVIGSIGERESRRLQQLKQQRFSIFSHL